MTTQVTKLCLEPDTKLSEKEFESLTDLTELKMTVNDEDHSHLKLLECLSSLTNLKKLSLKANRDYLSFNLNNLTPLH